MFFSPILGRAVRSFADRHRSDSCPRRVFRCALATLIFSSAFSAGTLCAADSDVLTLDKALRAAETHSQILTAYDASARASQERAVAAAQLPDPVLQLALDNLPAEGDMAFRLDEEPMTMQKVGVMQTYTRSSKRKARSTQFKSEAETAELRRQASVAELREQTAATWLKLHYRQRRLARMNELRKEAERAVVAADAEFRGGRGQHPDVFAARLALAQVDDELHEAQAQVVNTQYALERWTRLPQADLGPLPSIRETHWNTHGVDHPLDLHPDIAVMNAEERAAQARAEVARQETRGDWTWSLMYAKRDAGYEDMVSLGVSVPLEWNRKNRQNRELAAELALVDQARSKKEEMRRSHQLEIEQLLTEWRAQLTRLDHYQNTLLPLANDRAHATLAAYRGNRVPLSAVLEARRAEIEADIQRLRIEEKAAVLWAALEFRFPELAPMVLPDTRRPAALQESAP